MSSALNYIESNCSAVSTTKKQFSIQEFMEDGFLWAVPKTRRSVEVRTKRKYGAIEGYCKTIIPKNDILSCIYCGHDYEKNHLCSKLFKINCLAESYSRHCWKFFLYFRKLLRKSEERNWRNARSYFERFGIVTNWRRSRSFVPRRERNYAIGILGGESVIGVIFISLWDTILYKLMLFTG